MLLVEYSLVVVVIIPSNIVLVAIFRTIPRHLQQHEGRLAENTETEPEVDVAHLRVLRE